MAYDRYKKYRKKNVKIVDLKKKGSQKKSQILDLSKPLPVGKKELSPEQKRLIKNSMIIQQREFKKIKNKNARSRKIIEKHNEIMKKKSLSKVMDIFNLIKTIG